MSGDESRSAVTGWTRLATTDRYIGVANVLPAEVMYTDEEVSSRHPVDGEVIIAGVGGPIVADTRHVEVHVYDRTSGLPVPGLHVSMEVLNMSTGQRYDVAATEMQDLTIGGRDRHYGNNLPITGPADISVIVTIGTERMTFDGHLD